LPGLNATGYASYLRPALSRIAQHCPDVRQGFLAPATCLEIRNAMNQGVAEPAEVFDTGATLDVSTRRATSIDIDPVTLDVVEAMLDRARPAIGVACQTPVEGREGPAFLRYEPGGFYRRHRDRASDAEWPGAARRLIFPEPPGGVGTTEPMVIVPQQGTLVAFHASMLHEVRPVRRGTRDVIVDWYC